MSFYDLPEFFALSRAINYNLNSTTSGRYYVLKYIVNNQVLNAGEKGVMMKALGFCIHAYGDKKRRLGPPAVIHPLRATALLSRAVETAGLLNLLTEMFHDLFEDIFPFDFENEKWREIMASEFRELLGSLDKGAGDEVFNQLMCLTIRDNETYYSYIGRMLEDSGTAGNLVTIKLADRLDNTLDMRIDLQDPMESIDFFQDVFETMYLAKEGPPPLKEDHPPHGPLNGAWRLYELFKNSVLLSLIRQNAPVHDENMEKLFHALARASLSEAKRIYMHIKGYHGSHIDNTRAVLQEAMEYCRSGRIDLITEPDETWAMDGFFSTYFDHADKKDRKKMLDILYTDKALMMQAAICLSVIFMGFLRDEDYRVNGISISGIRPT